MTLYARMSFCHHREISHLLFINGKGQAVTERPQRKIIGKLGKHLPVFIDKKALEFW